MAEEEGGTWERVRAGRGERHGEGEGKGVAGRGRTGWRGHWLALPECFPCSQGEFCLRLLNTKPAEMHWLARAPEVLADPQPAPPGHRTLSRLSSPDSGCPLGSSHPWGFQ